MTIEALLDMSEVRGQAHALHAIEQALALRLEGENMPAGSGLLLIGPRGTAATMIARRITTLMPELTDHERIWLAAEYETLRDSRLNPGNVHRPFRAPHYTISMTALVGAAAHVATPANVCADAPQLRTICRCRRTAPAHAFHSLPRGPVPRAGELQLARFGVLFLDELLEFHESAIDALGAALRAMAPMTRPMLVASSTACPCGYFASGSTVPTCACSPERIERHGAHTARFAELLGIRHRAEVQAVSLVKMRTLPVRDSSATIRARIAARVGGATGKTPNPER